MFVANDPNPTEPFFLIVADHDRRRLLRRRSDDRRRPWEAAAGLRRREQQRRITCGPARHGSRRARRRIPAVPTIWPVFRRAAS